MAVCHRRCRFVETFNPSRGLRLRVAKRDVPSRRRASELCGPRMAGTAIRSRVVIACDLGALTDVVMTSVIGSAEKIQVVDTGRGSGRLGIVIVAGRD